MDKESKKNWEKFEEEYWDKLLYGEPKDIDHNYKNSSRPGDVQIEYLTKEEIIKILYKRLGETDKTLGEIRSLVTSSGGTKDIHDYNSEILNPLYSVFKDES